MGEALGDTLNTARTRNPIFLGLSAIWLCAVIGCLFVVTNYEMTPGSTGKPPAHWPAGTQIKLSREHPTLIMLAHPKCPCTRASISEVADLMTKHRGQVQAYILFLSPQNMPQDWDRTDLWSSAAAIPGVKVLADRDGTEARLFEAQTSGTTLLFDVDGRLLFSGGITGSRGHIGDNLGLQAVAGLLDKKLIPASRQHSFVFGCPLQSPLSASGTR